MPFKKDHPDYRAYASDALHVSGLPDKFSASLQGFIIRQCDKNAGALKAALNDIAGRIPTEPTTNWGWDFLLNDVAFYVNKLCKLPMPKVMDFLSEACTNKSTSFSVDELNEFLEGQAIGYVLNDSHPFGAPHWELRASVESRTFDVKETTTHVKDVCGQALEHLEQAREHLENTKTDRDRKDAVRDCLSAMESMLKELSGESDIKAATKKLRNSNSWGPDLIVKDGLSLWDRMHQLYPDVRHGNPNASNLSDEEALYWAERITCFIRYMSRVHKR